VQVTGSAQIDSETGAQVGTLAVFVDRTEQKRTERELQEANRQLQAQLAATEALQVVMREQAIRDSLTGLYNRRYLEETLEREVARAVRAKQPISIVMVDIDHFKQLNDVYGHQAGDRVLRALGDVLQAHSRRDDIACRFGGEEFVVMLAGTPLDVAVKRAEEWRYVFQETEVPYSPRSLHATLSAGIAAFPVHGKSGVALLQRADQALYQAKAEGRNRVSVLNVSDPATHP
jgi:diguanylate cyclase (GGDEF)-like protein